MATSQAVIFGTYLLRSTPSADAIALYENAVRANTGDADTLDTKALTFITRHPKTLSSIDAGLALIKPNSEVRRRLYVMFSILESMPEYHDHFLPKQRSFWYVFVVAGAGIRAIFRAIIGIGIIKVALR